MEKSTNKITNEQINKLILGSSQPMNSLGIHIEYSYFSELVNLNWYDILIAIKNEYLPIEAGIEHAIKEIETNSDYNNEVFNLAIISKNDINYDEEIRERLSKLADLVSNYDKGKTKEKLLFVVMHWIFHNQKHYEDPLRVVEVIYDDFDFPKIIKDIVRYESSSHICYSPIDKNIDRLYDNWQNYLIYNKMQYK